MSLDLANGHIYFLDSGAQTLERVDLDGSNQVPLVTGLSSPEGLVLDVSADFMYWVDIGTDTVERANLDGSGQTTLVAGLNNPIGITLFELSALQQAVAVGSTVRSIPSHSEYVLLVLLAITGILTVGRIRV